MSRRFESITLSLNHIVTAYCMEGNYCTSSHALRIRSYVCIQYCNIQFCLAWIIFCNVCRWLDVKLGNDRSENLLLCARGRVRDRLLRVHLTVSTSEEAPTQRDEGRPGYTGRLFQLKWLWQHSCVPHYITSNEGSSVGLCVAGTRASTNRHTHCAPTAQSNVANRTTALQPNQPHARGI